MVDMVKSKSKSKPQIQVDEEGNELSLKDIKVTPTEEAEDKTVQVDKNVFDLEI